MCGGGHTDAEKSEKEVRGLHHMSAQRREGGTIPGLLLLGAANKVRIEQTLFWTC